MAAAADDHGTEWLVECGCCGAFHRKAYAGDCRNDAERLPVPCLPYPDYTPNNANRTKATKRPRKQTTENETWPQQRKT